jgi:uncharacterized protein (TIGR02145 family)
MLFSNIIRVSSVFLCATLIQCCREVDPIEDVSSVTDYDSNSYKVVRIGNQLWMAENLKTTHFNDGTIIPLVTDNSEWINNHSPGLCYYNNDETSYKDIYGPLYNWYSVETGKLCPIGWHVPSDLEWTYLSNFAENAGGKLKETGTNHWQSPNTSDNASGFTALPGGYRKLNNGTFSDIGTRGFWSSSSLGEGHLSMGVRFYGPLVYVLNSTNDNITKFDLSVALPFSGKSQGSSIRCIKE